MKKFVVTWTFMRHIHRHRQYKILTVVMDAENEYLAEFQMRRSSAVQQLYKDKYDDKLKSYTCIDDYITKDLQESFEAGEDFANECNCGNCDYCLDVKTTNAPDFKEWYTAKTNQIIG